MEKSESLTIVIHTAETSVEIDSDSPDGVQMAVKTIMDAQVSRHHDGVDPSELSDDELLCRNLRDLAERIGRLDGSVTNDEQAWGPRKYGCNFKNEVFEMHPFWWDNCRCGFVLQENEWFSEHPYDWFSKNPDEAALVERNREYEEWAKTHSHAADCPDHPTHSWAGLPNFQCGGLSVSWYKYIGRDMECSEITRSEIEEVFKACFASLERF